MAVTGLTRYWNDLVKRGLVQSFDYTHELARKAMKDYSIYQGNKDVHGSPDATREAFALGLIPDGDVWMEMIKIRNQTSHTYEEQTANEIFDQIIYKYHPAFTAFQHKMEVIKS